MLKLSKNIFNLLFLIQLFLFGVMTISPNSAASQENNHNLIDTTELNKKIENYILTINNNYDSSRSIFKDILKHLYPIDTNFSHYAILALSKLISYEARTGNIQFSDTTSKIIIQEAKQRSDSVALPHIYLNTGRVFERLGQFDSAEYYFDLAYHYSRQYQFQSIMLKSRQMFGVVQAIKGNYKKAEDIFNEGMQLSRKYDNPQLLAEMMICLAVTRKRTGKIASALQLYKSSIETLENIGSKENYPEALNNLASVYMDLGVDSLAIQYFKKSVDVARELNSLMVLSIGLVNLASFEIKYDNYDTAYKYLSEALTIIENNSIRSLESTAVNTFGDYYLKTERKQKAKKAFHHAFSLSTKQHDINGIPRSALSLAKMYLSDNNPDSALWYAKIAYMKAKESDFLRQITEAARIIARGYEKKDFTDSAITYFKILDSVSTVYHDSLDVNNNRNFGYRFEIQRKEAENKILQKEARLKELELENKKRLLKHQRTRFILLLAVIIIGIIMGVILVRNYYQKNKINKLLQDRHSEIVKAYKKLQEENEFKSRLFSIVSHDVRSPIIDLHNFISVLSMRDIPHETNDEILSGLSEKINDTINLVDNILMWTRDQIAGDKPRIDKINIGEQANDIAINFKSNLKNKGIILLNNIPDDLFLYTDSNTASLVFRNLISNAIKFTPKGGKITLSVKEDENNYIFTVSDTGEGIKEEDKDKILAPEINFTTDGLNGEKGNGLGLFLCKKFLKQCYGGIWFDSEKNKGTDFHFSLPKNIK